MSRLPLAVVGVGHLGKEHARILSGMAGVDLVGVADPDRRQAEAVAARCGTRAFSGHRELLGQVAAAVVAAPTIHHHAIARDFLAAGVPLLVEKPLAAAPAEAKDLVALAAERGVMLQVGHIERFNSAFEELQSRSLRPCYVRAERYGGFTGRSTDVGAVLDLMIHDLDLVLTLARSEVCRVEALGFAVLGGHEDVAQARLVFADGCVADLSASRVHSEAKRQMQVWGPEGYAGVDFARRRLTLMQPGERLRQGKIDSRRLDAAMLAGLKGDLFGGYVQTCEVDCSARHRADQLTRELEEFVRCVREGAAPRVSGQAGLEALEVAGRVLDAVAAHQWEGRADGAVGPRQLPAAGGWLFTEPAREAA
jgi:predicted dehydrogenase